VFEDDTADARTLAMQMDKPKKRFPLERVALVGDRGMITRARIEEELKPTGHAWITIDGEPIALLHQHVVSKKTSV
jgi:hypothetical protein